MGEYLREYGSALAESIKRSAEPLYEPGQEWDEKVYSLVRRPYQAQGDAVMGLCEALRDYDSALVVGEMGCGKSMIGAAVPYVYSDRPVRSLVMCPGHLVGKWKREVEDTVPDAEATIARRLSDVLDLDPDSKPERPEYTIVSKDRAKLGYAWKPAAPENREGYLCPDCYGMIVDRDGVPVSYDYLARNRRKCPECGGALWQADNERIRRFPLAEYVKRYLPGYYDFFVADEVHELKGGSTAQGNAFGALAGACGKTLGLTGTLLGGYADDVFYVLFRLAPREMREEGLDYGRVKDWMARYGVLEKVTKTYPRDNVYSKGKKGKTTLKRKPGVSPLVFSRHLLDKSVFLGLQDIAEDLPGLTEHVHGVEMDPELYEAYSALEARLSSAMREALAKGSKALLGTYVNALLSYPDRPFGNGPILDPRNDSVIADPDELPPEHVYRKERQLLDVVRDNVSEGRKVFAYCQYTGKRDVTRRLQDLLLDEGVHADVLTASVSPEKREDWIRDRVDSGVDAVLANPRLVQTGLDLYDFPTLAFYQTGYSVFTLRQASRRSWRIGQDKPVRVHYLYYRPTMQEKAMQLMGSKLQASLAVEGKFSEEGLLAMTQGEDMTTAMAKALVDGLETEGVEDVWSRLNRSEERAQPRPDGMLFYVDPDSFTKPKRRRRKRKKRGPGACQLSLFED